MDVGDVDVSIPGHPGRVLCYANLVLGGRLKVRGLRLIGTADGRRLLAMPSRSHLDDGVVRHVDSCHPIEPTLRSEMTAAVVAAYERAMAAAGAAGVRERAWAGAV